MNLLIDLQRNLESFYRLDPAPPVDDFIVEADPEASRAEELLVRQGQELELALVLDSDALAALGTGILDNNNLQAFSLVVEGLSHYLMVIFRARQEQRTTAFELELQAEIDKYISGTLLARRCHTLPSDQLRSRLFGSFQLLDGLSAEEQVRYQRANRLAHSYAKTLEERFVRRHRVNAMVRELREFYRVGTARKQGIIAKH